MIRIIDDVSRKWQPGETRDIVQDLTYLATGIGSYVLLVSKITRSLHLIAA